MDVLHSSLQLQRVALPPLLNQLVWSAAPYLAGRLYLQIANPIENPVEKTRYQCGRSGWRVFSDGPFVICRPFFRGGFFAWWTALSPTFTWSLNHRSQLDGR